MNVAHRAAWALQHSLRHCGPALSPANAMLPERLGLDADLAAAMCWSQWLPMATRAGDPPIVIGLDARLPPARWPRALRSPWCQLLVAVKCVPCERPGQAQSWLRVANETHEFGNGTLGAILRVRGLQGRLCALTAGHVLGGGQQARANDAARLAVAGRDVQIGGRVRAWQPDFGALGREVAIDAGVMVIDPEQLEALADDIPWPTGVADATLAAPLSLLTRQHRLQARALGTINAPMNVGEGGVLQYRFSSALSYQVDAGSEPGDSGAPLWDINDRLVAIHTGSAPEGTVGNAVATPIRPVLTWADAEVVLRGDAQPAHAPVALASLASAPSLPDVAVGDREVAPTDEQARAIDTLARTMWAEARGEPDADAGMRAVAHVVCNRRDKRSWWGRSIEAVCRKPFQFSCWNEGDPNRAPLMRVTQADPQFMLATTIAAELVRADPADRARADTTAGATHYHARSMAQLPNWARGRTPCGRIGNHVFYRDLG